MLGILPAIKAADAAPQQRPGAIRVVMDDNYPPFVFTDGEGRAQGMLIDQWRLWERKTGIRVEIHAMDWADALRRMRAVEFDVIDTVFETPERDEFLSFSAPYQSIEVPAFFDREIAGITDAQSLRGGQGNRDETENGERDNRNPGPHAGPRFRDASGAGPAHPVSRSPGRRPARRPGIRLLRAG